MTAAPSRIALVGSEVSEQRGAGKVIAELAKRAAIDYDVTLVARSHEVHIASTTAVTLSVPRCPRSLQVPLLAIAGTRYVSTRRFPMVHSHDTFSFGADLYTAHSSFAGYMRHWRSGHSLIENVASHCYPPHLSLLAMSRRTIGVAPRIVAVSRSVKDELLAAYGLNPNQVEVIYNGVNAESFRSVPRVDARRQLAAELGADLEGVRLLAFVGHEFKRKRLDTVLQALAKQPLNMGFRLFVAGKDDPKPYERYARDLGISQFVSFLGARRDVRVLMRAADIFVFPTAYEAASLAVLEAAAAGVAIVTTDTAMAAEVCSDGHDALLIPNTDDPHPLAQTLSKLIPDTNLITKLGRNAELLAARFSWDWAWQQYRRLYEDLLRNRLPET